jgi:LmbE family N-acetylglucosaminyl deacetylase
LADMLAELFRPGDICVAPWRLDGHPDHDESGRAAIAAARGTGTPILEYMVWTWHWAVPGSAAVPWEQCRRLDLTRRDAARKRWATYAFTSQVRPLGREYGEQPLLPASVLRRFWRPFEVFIEAAP